jgi:hypothetical protein
MLHGFSQTSRSVDHILADFKAGKAEFRHLLKLEMRYPDSALKKGIEGKVGYNVKIEEDGSFNVGQSLFTLTDDLNQEAKRLINLCVFSPESRGSSPVMGTKQVIVRFNIDHYNNWVHRRVVQIEYNMINDTTPTLYQSNDLDKLPRPIYEEKYTSFENYIYSVLQYPIAAYKRNIFGSTTLEFVVEKSGNLTNIYPIKYLGGGCYEEAKKVLRSVQWKPALVDGKPARSIVRQTVHFRLN